MTRLCFVSIHEITVWLIGCRESEFLVVFVNWVTHICVGNLTIIGSDIGLSPVQRQAIIWTNAGILLIGPLRINFSEIFIEILIKEMHLKISSAKWRPFCLGHIVPKLDSCCFKNMLSQDAQLCCQRDVLPVSNKYEQQTVVIDQCFDQAWYV